MSLNKCKHLNFTIKGDEPIGLCSCPDCNQIVSFSEAMNNLTAQLRAVINQTESSERK